MSKIDWQETYKQTSPKLLGICRRYVKELAIAEDIVQDSFIVAMQKEDTLKNVKALNGWLSRIVVNMALHHIRTAKKTVHSATSEQEIVDKSSLMSNVTLDNKSQILASGFEVNDILEAMDVLPEHHRSVFNMYILDDFSHKEIAETLNISIGTSKSHLSRARKSVQKFLIEKSGHQPVEKNRKRIMALLIFLGFGNTLFANNCKEAFENFEIQNQVSELDFDKKVTSPNQFVGLQKTSNLGGVFAIGGSVVVASIAIWFILKDVPVVQKTIIIQKEEQQIAIPTNEEIAVDTIANQEVNPIKSERVIEPIITQVNHKVKKDEKEVTAIVENRPETTTFKKEKDSVVVKKAPIVIIKKRVITRDTVYVSQ